MNTGLNALGAHGLDKTIAVHALGQEHWKDVIGRFAGRVPKGEFEPRVLQLRPVPRRDLPAPRIVLTELAQLDAPQRRANLVDPVIVAEVDDVIRMGVP